jgi:hypothetical protein
VDYFRQTKEHYYLTEFHLITNNTPLYFRKEKNNTPLSCDLIPQELILQRRFQSALTPGAMTNHNHKPLRLHRERDTLNSSGSIVGTEMSTNKTTISRVYLTRMSLHYQYVH